MFCVRSIVLEQVFSNIHLHFLVCRVLRWLPLCESFGILLKSPQGSLRYGGDSAYRILPFDKNMLRILQEIKKFDIVYRIREQVRKAAIGLVFCEDDGYISRYRFRAQQGSLSRLSGCDMNFKFREHVQRMHL